MVLSRQHNIRGDTATNFIRKNRTPLAPTGFLQRRSQEMDMIAQHADLEQI